MKSDLYEARARAQEVFRPYRTVIGVGVGPKVRRGRVRDPDALVVLVGRKLAPKDIPEGELIPPSFEGFVTDVREPVLQVPPGKGKDTPPPGDWCRTDVQWIDWVKVHEINLSQHPGVAAIDDERPRRRSRGASDD